MEDDIKKLEDLLKDLKKERDSKPKFSKWIVMLVIFLATVFTVASLYVFVQVGNEPSTLIVAVFGFLTVEVWSLANIKNTETKKKRKQYDESKSMVDVTIDNSSKGNEEGNEWQ